MKKLFLLILLLCLGFSKAGNAQTVLDSVKFSPGYICQVDSFTISMQTFLVSQPGQVDSIQQFFRNDTLHLNGYLKAGMLASPTRVKITIKVKTPPMGNYTMYFNRYINDGLGSASNPYTYSGSHTDSFSVCLGVLSVPEKTSEDQLAVEVFPNPATDLITIQLPQNNSLTYTATLTDVTGKKVISQVLKAGNLAHRLITATLPAGIYILHLESESSFNTIKVIRN